MHGPDLVPKRGGKQVAEHRRADARSALARANHGYALRLKNLVKVIHRGFSSASALSHPATVVSQTGDEGDRKYH
jgi:hypothetical protein